MSHPHSTPRVLLAADHALVRSGLHALLDQVVDVLALMGDSLVEPEIEGLKAALEELPENELETYDVILEHAPRTFAEAWKGFPAPEDPPMFWGDPDGARAARDAILDALHAAHVEAGHTGKGAAWRASRIASSTPRTSRPGTRARARCSRCCSASGPRTSSLARPASRSPRASASATRPAPVVTTAN